MHIATWNVNSLKAREAHLLRWLSEASPDVVCLQETKLTDEQFPLAAIHAAGYPHVVFSGTKAYNGVAMLSKFPLTDVGFGFAVGEADPQPRLVKATVGGVRIFGCYVPNGQAVGSDKFAYKLAWLERLREEVTACDPGGDVIVCGDMNVALVDADVWDPFSCEGEVLYHPLEREAVRRLLAWGLVDSYRALKPDGKEFSWWDYRMLGFQKNHGFRIDHVFLTRSLMARCREITLWRPTRKWDKPSDHIPVSIRLE
jgi:exodeoxyribonuclease-3